MYVLSFFLDGWVILQLEVDGVMVKTPSRITRVKDSHFVQICHRSPSGSKLRGS